MANNFSKEDKARLSELFYKKHIDDFTLMFPYKENVSVGDIHAFVKALKKNDEMREYLELIKDVRSAYYELHPLS